MSTSDSRTTSSSRLSQFGLYRTIDARTEEFLRLSRKRQIRQGCACAAVSTAITVTVVVVILLIYEYAIAVDSSLVQRIRFRNFKNGSHEIPVADRLDRSYFGFDQDYFERMPLLVNAMQENSYVDPLLDATHSSPLKNRGRYLPPHLPNAKPSRKSSTSTFKYRPSAIRRTSPRPFYNEYRTPTPAPFSKSFGSRSWIESYKNAQRLKNLQQVMKYLEKTINAKFGDIYTLPTSTHIAFSGLYSESENKDKGLEIDIKPASTTVDLVSQNSNKVETVTSNHHQPDPFYSFKPNHPGDINLLADGFFRFSPIPYTNIINEETRTIPMFRPLPTYKKKCQGYSCSDTTSSSTAVEIINLQASGEIKNPEISSATDKAKPFSVFLNLFPLKPTETDQPSSETQNTIPKIHITTTRRPIFQLKRRSTTPIRRTTTTKFKKPRVYIRKLPRTHFYNSGVNRNSAEKIRDVEPKIIMHVNVYPSSGETKTMEQSTTESNVRTTQVNIRAYVTDIPILTSTQVEDYHVGSSGIIPVEARITPVPPPPIIVTPSATNVIPVMPFFDTTTASSEIYTRSTSPPEILKFSHEDARIQTPYNTLIPHHEFVSTQPTIDKRSSEESNLEHTESIKCAKEEEGDESRTLLIKLKNEVDSTTRETQRDVKIERRSEVTSMRAYIPQVTTVRTYVPQINGHYRSVNQNSKNINNWLNEESKSDRKRRLEQAVTGFRKPAYVPPYVEIRRNNTRNSSDEDKEPISENENKSDDHSQKNDEEISENFDEDDDYSDSE